MASCRQKCTDTLLSMETGAQLLSATAPCGLAVATTSFFRGSLSFSALQDATILDRTRPCMVQDGGTQDSWGEEEAPGSILDRPCPLTAAPQAPSGCRTELNTCSSSVGRRLPLVPERGSPTFTIGSHFLEWTGVGTHQRWAELMSQPQVTSSIRKCRHCDKIK